jgi:hypothetical protein
MPTLNLKTSFSFLVRLNIMVNVYEWHSSDFNNYVQP